MSSLDIIDICSDCGHPLGSNPKCSTCLMKNTSHHAQSVNEGDAAGVLDRILDWINANGGVGSGHFFKQVQLLYFLCRDWYDGKYTGLNWQTIATIIGTLLYVVMPVDLIPDFIPILGWTDDAAAVLATINSLRSELVDYLKFRGETPSDYGLD